MADILEATVDVESIFYHSGLTDGGVAGGREGLVQGRIYGTEVAYERMLQVGCITALVDIWRTQHAAAVVDTPRIAKAFAKVDDALAQVPYTNDESEVTFDHALDSVRLQFRFLAKAVGETTAVESLLDLGMPDVARFGGVADVEDTTGPVTSF